MVPDLSRRRLLAGGGALALGGAAGLGLANAGMLPGSTDDEGGRSIPEQVWHPPVSQAHADATLERLETTVDRAERLADRVERRTGSAPRWSGDPSGNWLEDARSASDPRHRLDDATSGLASAGHRIGEAKEVLGGTVSEDARERSLAVRSAADRLQDDLGDYPVSESPRDLAYLYFVEVECDNASFLAPFEGSSESSTWGLSEFHARLLRAEQALANARYYRDRYQELLDEQPVPVRTDVRAAYSTLDQEIEAVVPAGEARAAARADVDETTRLYRVAERKLYQTCYDLGYDHVSGQVDGEAGHEVQRLVDTGRELLTRRAFQFADAELDVEPDDESFDRSRAGEAATRARELYHETRSEYTSPLAGLLIEPAANRILVGDSRTDFGHTDENYLKARLYYLVAIGILQEVGDVLSIVRVSE